MKLGKLVYFAMAAGMILLSSIAAAQVPPAVVFESFYTRSECMVRVDIEYADYVDAVNRNVFSQLIQFILKYGIDEGVPLFFNGGGSQDNPLYLLHDWNCGKRFEITEKMMASALKKFEMDFLALKVSHEIIFPGPNTMNVCSAFWTDCPQSRNR